jgi:8-oxo-dGTP pyrophosphatase MutT (NUDIX family)
VSRDALLAALDAYGQRHGRERDTVARFAAFIAAHERCFERALQAPGHVTGSAWIVAPEGDAVLLTHHRKLDLWVQLGGHADGDPDPLAVALREGLEESGLPTLEAIDPYTDATPTVPFDVDIHEIPERKGEPAHFHYDVRFAFRAPHRDVVVSDESHDLAWVPLARIADYTREESMLRMAGKWIDALDRAGPPDAGRG